MVLNHHPHSHVVTHNGTPAENRSVIPTLFAIISERETFQRLTQNARQQITSIVIDVNDEMIATWLRAFWTEGDLVAAAVRCADGRPLSTYGAPPRHPKSTCQALVLCTSCHVDFEFRGRGGGKLAHRCSRDYPQGLHLRAMTLHLHRRRPAH